MPPPVPPVNPVLYLLAMDGTGTTFVDDGPDHLTVSRVGGATDIITQDDGVTLFGLNTGLYNRSSTVGTLAGLLWSNPAKPLTADDDLCVEWWCYPIFGHATASQGPTQQTLRWTNNGQLLMGACHGNAGMMRFYAGSEGTTNSGSQPQSLLNWHYNAMQYVAADGRTYCSTDGVLVSTLTNAIGAQPGFDARAFAYMPGNASARTFSARVAQLRATKANLYGSSAAPVPAGPWPKF